GAARAKSAAATGCRVVFFCAFGERSAMAVAAAKSAGLANTAHIEGGIDAWKKAGGPGGMGCLLPKRRVGKGAHAPCPPSIRIGVARWWARFALPTLRFPAI